MATTTFVTINGGLLNSALSEMVHTVPLSLVSVVRLEKEHTLVSCQVVATLTSATEMKSGTTVPSQTTQPVPQIQLST
jgi:hypothetical protein